MRSTDRKKSAIQKSTPEGAKSPSKVFIVEDHPAFREGLVQIVNGEEDLRVCGFAGNATQALKAIGALQPDLVLVDITLPGKSGLQLIKELHVLDEELKVLVVSMHDEALYADRVLRAGGNGYIMKQEDPEEIINAIRDVLAGHIYVSEQILAAGTSVSNKINPKSGLHSIDLLNDSQLEILESLGQGKSSAEIANQVGIPVKKVTHECGQIRTKLRLKSANALIRYAVCWVERGNA
jgi:DNA-binding NarL/FixJ family response regulator